MPATVLIVDDHAGFRRSARRILEADGYEVVGEAADGAEALAAVERLRPQIVLLDVFLPDIDGFEVAKRIASAGGQNAPVIVLTSSHDREDLGDGVTSSSAAGFVPKDELSGAAVAALIA